MRSAGTFDEGDKGRVAMFLPYLLRALQIRRRLSDADIKYRAALDALERTTQLVALLLRSIFV